MAAVAVADREYVERTRRRRRIHYGLGCAGLYPAALVAALAAAAPFVFISLTRMVTILGLHNSTWSLVVIYRRSPSRCPSGC